MKNEEFYKLARPNGWDWYPVLMASCGDYMVERKQIFFGRERLNEK